MYIYLCVSLYVHTHAHTHVHRYGRGQRQSLEVERSDLVDFSKMTDKQFNKHCRESDKNEDEVFYVQ